jgi:hypothetical protein
MSIFPKFFFTLFGNALPSWLRSYIARVEGDGGIIVDTGHTKEVYADVIDYNPLLIQTCDGGSADDLYSLFAFDDIDDLQLRVVADSGTNADVGQNAKVAQHLWRNDLHASASIVVTCASIKAGKLYGYQPTVEPDTTLLDYYTGSAAAYSLRSLSTSTTNVVKVRRSGDDAELDFTASEVSDGTLAAWVVAGGGTEDGFVTTWYDQSGNGKNATQATAANQPKIVSSGTLVTENGKAALDFDGTNDAFNISVANDFFGINDISAYFVTKNATSSETGGIMQKRTAVTDGNFGVGASGGTYQFQTRDTGTADIVLNTVSTYSTQELISIIRNSSGLEMFSPEQITQSDTVADLTSTGALEIGTGPSYGNLDGVIQEIILYLSDQSANRTGIEANINDYYNIYP